MDGSRATWIIRVFEPGRDAQRRKERRAIVARLQARLPDARLREAPGRVFVECDRDARAELAALHGVVSFSRGRRCALAELERCVVDVARAALAGGASFRVRVRRTGAHSFGSPRKAAELGHAVCAAVAGARVDLAHPDVVIGVEIRDDECYVFDAVEPGLDRCAATAPMPTPAGEPRFLVDQMLGRLRAWLRLVGVDAAGTHDEADGTLLARAVAEGRVVLTRDRALARVAGVPIRYVEGTRPAEQLREVAAAFGLVLRRERLMSRCTFCNVPVQPIDEAALGDRAPSVALRLYARFYRCPACERIYWPGDQYARVVAALSDLLRD